MADLHVGDYGLTIQRTIQQNGAALDLTNATVTFYFVAPRSSERIPKATVVESPPTSGIVTYVIEEGLIDRAGDWQVEVEVLITGTPDKGLHGDFVLSVEA